MKLLPQQALLLFLPLWVGCAHSHVIPPCPPMWCLFTYKQEGGEAAAGGQQAQPRRYVPQELHPRAFGSCSQDKLPYPLLYDPVVALNQAICSWVGAVNEDLLAPNAPQVGRKYPPKLCPLITAHLHWGAIAAGDVLVEPPRNSCC